jgi:hypothetical protein
MAELEAALHGPILDELLAHPALGATATALSGHV